MTNRAQPKLFPGAVELMILRILEPQGLHGYALTQAIQRTSNNLLRVQGGTLYQALQRLQRANLVKVEWGRSSTNRRIQIYTLTAGGAEHLFRELSRVEKMLEGFTRVLASAGARTHSCSNSPVESAGYCGTGCLPTRPNEYITDRVEPGAQTHVPYSSPSS
jgi:DNA-binding PadR family transcriptional regulator